MFNFKINMYTIHEDLNVTCTYNLGYESIVQSFFSTIAYHLENKKWGSVYPAIMNEFYKGKLEQNRIDYAIAEIKDIKKKLSKLKASDIICDINNLDIKPPFDSSIDIPIELFFCNYDGITMPDIILNVLESIRNKKNSLYIGEYYYKELNSKEVIDTIVNAKKKKKRNTIIKYLIYMLIVIIIKFVATESQFNSFLKTFIFSMIIAEIFYFHTNKTIENKKQESMEKRLSKLNNNKPKLRIERITKETNLTSSTFDYVLNHIKCPKEFDVIKDKLALKKVKNWQADLKNIHQELGYDINFAEDMINSLKKYENIELYTLTNGIEFMPKEIKEELYNDNDIYRIIKNEEELYVLIFKNK